MRFIQGRARWLVALLSVVVPLALSAMPRFAAFGPWLVLIAALASLALVWELIGALREWTKSRSPSLKWQNAFQRVRGGVVAILALFYVWWAPVVPSWFVKTPESVRIKYRSTQIVWVGPFVPEDPVLSLDNVGMLALLSTRWDLTSIELSLVNSPPVFIETPQRGRDYRIGERTLRFKSGTRKAIAGHVVKKYVFTLRSPEHTIERDGRKFRVVLQSVADKSEDQAPKFAYTFGISEE
jgi:hypothetical protein